MTSDPMIRSELVRRVNIPDNIFQAVTLAVVNLTLNTTSGEVSRHPVIDQQCVSIVFTVNKVLVPGTCIFGTLANIISLLVLRKERGHRVIAFLLQALAVADTMLLVLSFIILTCIFTVASDSRPVLYVIKKFIEPLTYIPLVATVWITVLIALNR